MKKIFLPTSMLELEVPNKVNYHNDGQVRSIIEHSNMLDEKYGFGVPLSSRIKALAEIIGLGKLHDKIRIHFNRNYETTDAQFTMSYDDCTYEKALKKERSIHFHTYLSWFLNDDQIIYGSGHEEGHVAVESKNIATIENAIGKIWPNHKYFMDLYEESVCDVLGMYSLVVNRRNKNSFDVHENMNEETLDWLNYNKIAFLNDTLDIEMYK